MKPCEQFILRDSDHPDTARVGIEPCNPASAWGFWNSTTVAVPVMQPDINNSKTELFCGFHRRNLGPLGNQFRPSFNSLGASQSVIRSCHFSRPPQQQPSTVEERVQSQRTTQPRLGQRLILPCPRCPDGGSSRPPRTK